MGSLPFRFSILLFLAPAFLLYAVFFVTPFLWTLFYSFHDWNGFATPEFAGLSNYAQLAQDDLFLAGVGRVGLWAVLAIIFKVGAALILASLLREKISGSGVFITAFFIPVVISSAAISLLFTLIYDLDAGLLNTALRAVGLQDWTRNWLGDPDTALLSVIAVPVWHTIGYFFIILLAAMHGIPRDLYEAAEIDGANRWTVFSRITVPMVWPVLSVCIVLAITGALKSFDYVFVLTRGGPGTATQVPATYLYETIFVGLRYGYGTAMATAIFVIGLVSTLVVRRLMRVDER